MTLAATNRRPGFTLLEVMLVLAILAIVAAMSWPAFDAWFQSQYLSEAADVVRTNWVKARARAMDEGRPYRFAWRPNEQEFRIAPDEMDYWPDLVGSITGPQSNDAQSLPGIVIEKKLPSRITFTTSPTDGSGGNAGNGGWCDTFLIFQPDGSARVMAADGSDPPQLDVAVANERGQIKTLRMRAITCVVTLVSPNQL